MLDKLDAVDEDYWLGTAEDMEYDVSKLTDIMNYLTAAFPPKEMAPAIKLLKQKRSQVLRELRRAEKKIREFDE